MYAECARAVSFVGLHRIRLSRSSTSHVLDLSGSLRLASPIPLLLLLQLRRLLLPPLALLRRISLCLLLRLPRTRLVRRTCTLRSSLLAPLRPLLPTPRRPLPRRSKQLPSSCRCDPPLRSRTSTRIWSKLLLRSLRMRLRSLFRCRQLLATPLPARSARPRP